MCGNIEADNKSKYLFTIAVYGKCVSNAASIAAFSASISVCVCLLPFLASTRNIHKRNRPALLSVVSPACGISKYLYLCEMCWHWGCRHFYQCCLPCPPDSLHCVVFVNVVLYCLMFLFVVFVQQQ